MRKQPHSKIPRFKTSRINGMANTHSINPLVHHIMKKLFQAIATIALLCAVVFLGGEWSDDVSRAHVILCDGSAILLIAACSIYLRASGAFKKEAE